MGIRFVIACFAVVSFIIIYGVGGGAGTSIVLRGTTQVFEASSSPAALLGAGIFFWVYLLTVSPLRADAVGPVGKTLRRAGAWLIDILVSFSATSSLLTLLPLITDALRTGRFTWTVTHQSATTLDWITTLSVTALAFVGIAFYWAIPVLRGGQTVGQCIAAVRVVHTGDEPVSGRRVWIRSLLQPIAPVLWLGKVASGRYWHDHFARTTVVRVPDRLTAAA